MVKTVLVTGGASGIARTISAIFQHDNNPDAHSLWRLPAIIGSDAQPL